MRRLKNKKGQAGGSIIAIFLILFLASIIMIEMLPELQTIIDNAIAIGGFDSTTILFLGLIPLFFVASMLARIMESFRPTFTQV